MRYIDEYRNKKLVAQAALAIRKLVGGRDIALMEVCGTHTQNFRRYGLHSLLPHGIRLIAGPGCPVCVSSQGYIDAAIKLASMKDVIVLTFGDMMRVPGTVSSLEKERARFGNVHVVYSPQESVEIALDNPEKKVVFLAVGFETTAPTIALSILKAKKAGLTNLSFLSSLKLIPPVMEFLLRDGQVRLDGFLCPGHVSAIIGSGAYAPIVKKFKVACCVAGFEPLDILEGIYLLARQIIASKPCAANQYTRVVTKNGNPRARSLMYSVFEPGDVAWRSLGRVAHSGLRMKKQFKAFDAECVFSISAQEEGGSAIQKRCRCGDILKGLLSPPQCRLYGTVCTIEHPVGPCMVSTEGACNAYLKYR